jgi:glucose dehydrogenase
MHSCITVWNGMVFVPSMDGPLAAFDADTGEELWTNTDVEGGFWDTSPTVVDSIIYIGGEDHFLHAIHALSGELDWETDIGGRVECTPAVHSGIVVVGSAYNVRGVDCATGDVVWTTAGSLHGSAGIADGVAYWGDCLPQGEVHAVDLMTGEELWTYQTGATTGIQSSPAITDGTVYIAVTDGNLYAFGTGLKFTYSGEFIAQGGPNELIAEGYADGTSIGADTVSFLVETQSVHRESTQRCPLTTTPNPFCSALEISFSLTVPSEVRLSVYDLAGRLVDDLWVGSSPAGEHVLTWAPGSSIPAGCYLVVLDTPGERQVRRVVRL